jgi:hypothetical protein
MKAMTRLRFFNCIASYGNAQSVYLKGVNLKEDTLNLSFSKTRSNRDHSFTWLALYVATSSQGQRCFRLSDNGFYLHSFEGI